MSGERLLSLVFVLLLCSEAALGAARLYVDPLRGKDTNPGTADKPLQTLPAAQAAVRRLKAVAEGPIDVILKPGIYRLTEPLVFTPEDSGTAERPITWRAAEGAPVLISGGVPINGWKRGNDGIWRAPAPKHRDFRLLRVGERWAIRARHPNFDPQNPRTGGWAFAAWGGKPWEKGAFNVGITNTHNKGDTVIWRLEIPAPGRYRLWQRYAHNMKQYGVEQMDERTAMRVDEGEWIPLRNLPDTGSWNTFRWAHVADIDLPTAGEHVFTWRNNVGGGINLDAFLLTDDEQWDPNEQIGPPSWWGAAEIKPVAAGKHLILWQGEACESAIGPEISVPKPVPPGQTDGIGLRPGDFAQFQELSGAEAHIFIAWGWVNAIVPVAGIDHTQRKILFAEPAAQDVRIGNRFFIENFREALDAPGEWILDKAAGEILYIPDSSAFPRQEVVAPLLDRLIVLQGDPANGRFVEHLRFRGLRFSDTDYNLTREYYHPRDATIVFSGARYCAIRDCEFSWLGGYALRLEQQSEQCRFVRNHVHDMGQGGVIFWGGTKEQAHHCYILGNTMERLGLIYKHVAGVYITHGSDNHIAWNRIVDVPRYAISCKSQGEDRLAHRNVVEYNEMIRTNLETNDTGAFESLGYEHRDSGNIVRYNLILDSVGLGTTPDGEILTPYFTWGIYLDDYSSGTTVFGNIVVRTVNGGGCIHGGQNNRFENNIFVEGHEHQMRLQPRDDFCRGNVFVRNIIYYSRPEAQIIYSWRKEPAVFSACDYNLYYCTQADIQALTNIFPLGSLAAWRAAGFDQHSLIADPLFVDPAKDDYRLQPDSPAWRLGFQRLPVERIGPKGMPEDEAP